MLAFYSLKYNIMYFPVRLCKIMILKVQLLYGNSNRSRKNKQMWNHGER